MFDFLRNLGRSDKEKQQGTLNAYLDDELAPAERTRFEQQLAQNSDLQDELAEMQFWQQQMRDLPTRRVPRNFTLDPALFGRPQRQFLGNAYPVLRTATALTAFLLVIALVANVYMSSFSVGAEPQPAIQVAQEMAPAPERAVEEAAPAEPVQDEGEMLVEEEMVIEEEMAIETDVTTEGVTAEPLATPFALELSVDKESEAAEAPVEIAGAEEAPLADAVDEEAFVEPELGEEEEIISEELREELSSALESSALEIVEETAESPAAGDGEAAPSTAATATAPPALMAEEAPLATTVPEQEEPPRRQLVPTEDDLAPQETYLLPVGFDAIILGLGLLFIFLIILTMIARGRR